MKLLITLPLFIQQGGGLIPKMSRATSGSSSSGLSGLLGAPSSVLGGTAAGGGGPMLSPSDWQPSVEVRLSPPRHPLPEVSSKIEILDRTRLVGEERQTTKLIKAYNEELTRSRQLITALIARAMDVFDDPAVVPPRTNAPLASSFFDIGDKRERPGRIWVSVEEAPPIDGAVVSRIEAIEKKNMKSEFLTFQAAIEDMSEVTRMTLQQLNESLINIMRPLINTTEQSVKPLKIAFVQLGAAQERCEELQTKFGQDLVPNCDVFGEKKSGNSTSIHEHEISVFADEHLYPTVESLVQDMLKRREVDEELLRSRSLALMARLAQEQSTIAQELLQAAVSSITVQYSKVIRATNMTRDEMKQYMLDHPPGWKKTFQKSQR